MGGSMIILFLILIIIVTSSSSPKPSMETSIYENGNQTLKVTTPNYVPIYLIDGCEYIAYSLTGLTHKGNCKNHEKGNNN